MEYNKESKIIKFNKDNVFINKSLKEYGFTHFAKRVFEHGDIVAHGFGRIINHQTPHVSIQINSSKHYIPKKWTGRYWNHSCNPNTYIKTRKDGFPDLIALREIRNGEEITYSYWMSEFSWSKNADENSVECKCGEKKCKKKILSFSKLSRTEKLKLIKNKYCAKYLTTFLVR